VALTAGWADHGLVTLTQLSAFVLVARLGSVKAAAQALNVSEPAVSQALTALRQHLGDQLVSRRETGGMALTSGGSRLLPIASQMVALGAEAQAAVRAAQGLPTQLRLVTTSVIAEFIAGPLTDAFTRKLGRPVETSSGVAAATEMPVLVANRLADVALGPELGGPDAGPGGPDQELVSEPVFRCKMIAVTSPRGPLRGPTASWPWLVDPSGVDPASDTSRLLRRLGVPESRVMVFPNQTAAWAAAADGDGVAPGVAHLLSHQLRRGELRQVETAVTPMEATWYASSLPRNLRPSVVSSLRHFLSTPEAMQLMRAPHGGVPPSAFRPPVYVTIWS
jgi:LysR family transcriptional regulator, low CO2-responsive transcriptional regulator